MAKRPDELSDLNKAGQEFIQTVRSIASVLKENSAEMARVTGEAKQKSVVEDSKSAALGKLLAGYTSEQLKDKKALNRFEIQYTKALSVQAEIQSEIAFYQDKLVNGTKEEQELARDRIENLQNANKEFDIGVGHAEKLKDELLEIDNKVTFFDNLAEFGKQIPGLSGLFGEFERAAIAAREAAARGEDSFAAGARQLTGAAGKIAAGGFFSALFKGFTQGQDNITQFSRQLNISRDSANQLNLDFQRLGRQVVGATGNDFVAATLQLSNNLGVTARMSNESVVAFTTLTKQLGLSAEEASNLARFSAATGQEVDRLSSSIVGTVLAQNAATDSGIRYQDILSDISNASAATQLTTSKFPGGLAKAAYEARRFGLTLASLEKSAEGLLNFESSIAGELEAELLTGKQLNLERARMAALTGNTAVLAQELAANFGTAEEFSKLNVIQQNALAQSMGMSREELAKTLQQQAALEKFQVSTAEGLKEEVAKRESNIRQLERAGKFEEARLARQQLYEDLGDEELGRQRQNQSLMESQAELLQDIASAAQSIAKPFDFLNKTLQSMSTVSFELFGFLGKIGSKLISLGSIFGQAMTKNIDEAVAASTKFFPKLISALKIGGKTGTTALLKKIPVIGLLVGAGMAIKRFTDGDVLGGLLELGSGVASLFPGVGTGVSIGTDLALLGLDAAKITGESRVVTKETLPYAMSMGTSALNMFGGASTAAFERMAKAQERVLEESQKTRQAIERERVINLDGRKVNENLSLASSKFDRR